MPPPGKRSQENQTGGESLPEAVRPETSALAKTGPFDTPPYIDVFETAPQALALWRLVRGERDEARDLQICAANEAFRNTFDLPDMVGHRLDEIDPDYRQRSPDILGIASRVAASGTMESDELYHPLMDRWLAFNVSPAPGDLLLTYVVDITDRRQAERSVRRLQYSLDQIDDYPTWVDSQGRIIEVSESTCRHLEYSREELLNMTVFDISIEMEPEGWEQSWTKAKTLGSFRREGQHRAKSGRTFPVELVVNHMVFDEEEYDCVFCRDISERKALEESLLLTKLSVDNAPDMIQWVDDSGHIAYANRATCDLLGYSIDELRTIPIWEINAGLTAASFREQWPKTPRDSAILVEDVWKTKDGRQIPVEISASHVVHNNRELGLAFVRDISERSKAEMILRESEEKYRQLSEEQGFILKALQEREEQLLHAQKMEAIGRLAGGIAHDFNNVLTTIIGYADLLLSSPDCPRGSVTEDIGEIKAAAERASGLTRQILAFSRRQTLQPAVMSIDTIVADTERLLARTLGSDVELVTDLGAGSSKVEVDEHHFVQVLLNLAVNARDAMPDGGTLTIATQDTELDERFCQIHPDARPGSYVQVTVSDTGTGMDPDVLNHVFEPFYTTKPQGQGTGLGLATVYGIVAQSSGFTYVQSDPGRGTTFTIYLPRVDSPGRRQGQASEDQSTEGQAVDVLRTGDERSDVASHTIMVVDPDPTFLRMATRMLERRGYRVLSVGYGKEAFRFLSDSKVRVDALLVELDLPGTLTGTGLAAYAAANRRGMPILFTSRRPREAVIDSGEIEQCEAYLEKPYTAEELTLRLRTCLNERRLDG